MEDTNQSPATRPTASAPTQTSSEDLIFIASRITAADWLAAERAEYADQKYDADLRHINDLDMHTHGLSESGTWIVFLTNYLRRAEVLGIDTLQGRQAFGKFVVTAMSAFETMIRTEGKPPLPGVHSGQILDWQQ